MSEQKFIAKMTGYKATNANLTCQGFQFEIGKWYEHKGAIKLCPDAEEAKNGIGGFHFCVHPSGVWCYYSNPDTRVFEVEAEQVLEIPILAGADFKLVARRIRLVKEITPGKSGNDKSNTGDRNTGDRNTGHRNTGDRNTGHRNTGDRNTGDSNTGHRNTGHSNTGDRNTGHRNTGDRNTGDSNTGDSNTGHRNTGHRNTGHWNTGHWNTGHWNTGDRSCGVFCSKEPRVMSFDVQTKLTMEEFLEKYPEANQLGGLLENSDPIDFKKFKRIPGITRSKLKNLHKTYLDKRKAKP